MLSPTEPRAEVKETSRAPSALNQRTMTCSFLCTCGSTHPWTEACEKELDFGKKKYHPKRFWIEIVVIVIGAFQRLLLKPGEIEL